MTQTNEKNDYSEASTTIKLCKLKHSYIIILILIKLDMNGLVKQHNLERRSHHSVIDCCLQLSVILCYSNYA